MVIYQDQGSGKKVCGGGGGGGDGGWCKPILVFSFGFDLAEQLSCSLANTQYLLLLVYKRFIIKYII